ncbi:MAG: HYR domain-containing protein [Bacteroidetes bacterium]|nr:HYR domain-containing protein [Bacteroidota bacterium]
MNSRILPLFLLLLVAANVFCQVPTSGLLAHFPFDKTTDDKSNFQNNGKTNGGVTFVEDRFGNKDAAVHFNGTDAFISVANSAELRAIKSGFTICVWVKLEKGNAPTNDINLPLLCKQGQYRFFLKRTFGDLQSTILLSNEISTQDNNYTNHPIEFGQWYFIALVLDDNFIQLYQNGKLVSVGVCNKMFAPNDSPLEIGRDNTNGAKYFSGSLDDLRIYRQGLNAFEINALYNDTTVKHPPVEIKFSVTKNIEINTDEGNCFAKVIYTEPTATTIDGNKIELKLANGFMSGAAFGVGKSTVTYETTPSSGTKQNTSFIVSVTDNEPPKLVCPADISAVVDGGIDRAKVIYPTITVSDNCPNVKSEMISGFRNGYLFPKGVTQVKYRATDVSGNINECDFKVTVADKKKPEKAIAPKPTPVAEKAVTKVKEKKVEIKKEEPVPAVAPVVEKKKVEKTEEPKPVVAEIKTVPKIEPKTAEAEKEQPVPSVPPVTEKRKVEKPAEPKPILAEEKTVPKIEPKKAETENEQPVPKVAVIPEKNKAEKTAPPKTAEEILVKAEKKIETKKETPALPVVTVPEIKEEPVVERHDVKPVQQKPTTSAKDWRFNCRTDTIIHLPANRKGVIYHYSPPTVTNSTLVESIQQTVGTHDGCFLPIGVHPFTFVATDNLGKVQTCTYSVIVKDDLAAQVTVVPKKLETQLDLGGDSIHYEHKADVKDCFLTIFIYDDGEEDNDTVSIVFNGQVIVNREMIRVKEHGVIIRKLVLLHDNENYIIAKAWNTGRYGLNTLKMDVYEGDVEADKKFKKPVLTKVLHSKPGNAGGMILKCSE